MQQIRKSTVIRLPTTGGVIMANLPPYRPLPGDWFYGTNCPECGVAVPFGPDPMDGEGEHAFKDYPGWQPSKCKNAHSYRFRACEMLRVFLPKF